jgi:murein DD-endopeptidase MepM/ murein hydrolase activator NlpD
MRKLWILAGIAVMTTACSDEKTPLAPTAVAAPAPPLATPPLPTTVPGVLAISMPIDPGDFSNNTFGMEPFGYHGPDHAQDGHAGWDIEYRAGGVVRAAAAGTIQEVNENSLSPGRFSVIIEHVVGEHFYRTIYTNLVNVPSDVAPDEVVFANQALGTAGNAASAGASGISGAAMIHFQLEDLEFHREGFSSPKAVTPESFLTAPAKSIFDALWSRAIFDAELVEPFATNSRQVSPVSRTWTRVGGDGPAGIRFTRVSPGIVEYNYELLAESGVVTETGAVAINVRARPYALIALTAPTQVRLGLYDIVSNEMRLALALPGAARPSDLSSAAVYRSTSR